MAQKVNPISLRCPSAHKTYTDCWYSDTFYTTLQLKKMKLESHVQGMLKQKGLPEGQISLAGSSKSHRYLVCTLDPQESRMHKSLRYRVRPYKSEKQQKVLQNKDTNVMSQKTSVVPVLPTTVQQKTKAVHHALTAALINTPVNSACTSLTAAYTRGVTPKEAKKSPILNFFGSKYQQVVTGVNVWTSAWESHHADFIAQEVAYALARRVPFRSIKLQLIQELESNTNKAWGSVLGIRVTCAGRGNRKSKKAQRAQTVRFQWGQTSLHMFSEKVGFSSRPALTSFGKIGVKVWVCYK